MSKPLLVTVAAALLAVMSSALAAVNDPSGPDLRGSPPRQATAARLTRLLNADWRFLKGENPGAEVTSFDDSAWEKVNIPHSASIPYWMDLDVYEGCTWYRKELSIDDSWKSKRVFVEFEAAFQHAWVYLNGKLLGEHKGGYTGFCYDLTPNLHFGGKNILAVRLKNGWEPTIAPRAGDSIFPNGINRNVRLIVTHPLHVDWCGQFITTPAVSEKSARVNVKTEIRNNLPKAGTCSISVEVIDAAEKVVGRSTGKATIPAGKVEVVSLDLPEIADPHLWSPESPYLYQVRTRLSNEQGVIDEYKETMGIRWFEFSADHGFFLNGKHLYLRGFNAHEDRAGWGTAATDAAMERDMKILKDLGSNCIRASHNPHPRAFYQACDRLGLLVWDELHLWGRGGFKGGEEGSYTAESYPTVEADIPEFEKNLTDNFRDMIREHRNYPSIIVWSLGNENVMQMKEPLLSKMRALYHTLNDLSHSLDPTRPTGTGHSFQNEFIADISGYNGGGPKSKPAQKATLTTEWNGDFDKMPTPDDWRAGALHWVAFDYGTHCYRTNKEGIKISYGFHGMMDYHRLPKGKYYQFSQAWQGREKPVFSSEKPATLELTADKTTLRNDGTDDTQLIVTLRDATGKRVAKKVAATLRIVSGPGQLPTGKSWDLQTVNNGQQAIEFRCYQAGKTVLEVTSPGLESASLEITTLAAPDDFTL